VGNMLPVGIPPELGVHAGNDQAGNGDTGSVLALHVNYTVSRHAAVGAAPSLQCR
jgi:hypothetical protein